MITILKHSISILKKTLGLSRCKHNRLLFMFIFLWGQPAFAVFDPILIEDDNYHRIWKITGANSINDLVGAKLNTADGIGPKLVEVGTYPLGYNIQDLAMDNDGRTWALAAGDNKDGATRGHAYIGKITENAGVYAFTDIIDLGQTYASGGRDHGKALIWDPDNQYFIYEANPVSISTGRETVLKAYDPITQTVVADPWGTGNAEIVIPLPVDQSATYIQALAFSPSGDLYASVGNSLSIILKLERNASNQLTGNSTLIGAAGLDQDFRNIEVMFFAPDGELCIIESNGGNISTRGKMYKVDITTGVTTEVVDLDLGMELEDVVTDSTNRSGTRDWEGIQFNTPVYTPKPTFECTTDSYLFMSPGNRSTPTSGISINLTTGVATNLNGGNTFHPTNINAIGYNIKDGFIWGYDRPNEKVVRVDKDYNVVSYTIAGLPANAYHTGDISLDGILYLAERHNEGGKIYKVNVNPASADYLQYMGEVVLSDATFFSDKSISDFAFHPKDGNLYAVGVNSRFYKISPDTGVITDLGVTGLPNRSPNATWFDKEGYFYFNGTSTAIYRIDLTNPSIPNPTAVKFSETASARQGDAARCAVAEVPPPLATTPKCFAMTDNVAELYSFDLDINTPPTKVATSKILIGEGATYRASNNSIYTFNQEIKGNNKPSDLYRVQMDGTMTLVVSEFLTQAAVGLEFISYASGSEHLVVLQREFDSKILIFDANDLANKTPLKTIPLTFPDGSLGNVSGLAINPVTGEILVADDAADSVDIIEIYSVNMNTGNLTLKTKITTPGIDAESLAFAEDGELYTENESRAANTNFHHSIFRVDLSTGDLTAVEDIDGIVTGDIEGMSCTGSKIQTSSSTTLTIVTTITNDDGGSADIHDMGMTSSAGVLNFNAGATAANSTTYTSDALTINTGTYEVTAGTIANYTQGDWNCTGSLNPTMTGSNPINVTIAEGDHVTCTTVYSDEPATPPSSLTIVAKVINDDAGSSTINDFGISTTAGALVFDAGTGATSKTYTATALSITGSSSYDLSADEVSGYASQAWSCSEAGANIATSVLFTEGKVAASITLIDGANVTCTVEYDDIPEGCDALTGDINAGLSPVSSLRATDRIFLGSVVTASGVKSGHLKAFEVDGNGAPTGNEKWDAYDNMNATNRTAGFYSSNTSSAKVAFSTLLGVDFGVTNASATTLRTSIYNAALAPLSTGSNLALITNEIDTLAYLDEPDYRSHYTNAVSQRTKRVLASSDDGFLYAFNQSDGELGWAWMPRSLLNEVPNGTSSFQAQHYMQGSIDVLDLKNGSDYNSYIVGSYKQGLGQYVLRISEDTSSNLAEVIWDEDNSASKSSAPNNGKRAYFKDGDNNAYTAYITTDASANSTLTIRSLTSGTTTIMVPLSFNATSTPYIMLDVGRTTAKKVYLGDDVGNIYSAPLLQGDGALHSAGDIQSALGTAITALNTDPTEGVKYIGSARSSTDSAYYLRAQSETRLTVFKYTSGSWVRHWTTYEGGRNKWTSGTTVVADNDITPLLTDAKITDNAYIVADSLVLPVMEQPDGNDCVGDSYYYFYKLTDGHFPANTFYNGNTALTTRFGLGEGRTRRLHLSNLIGADRMLGLGMSDQTATAGVGINGSFTIKDPFTTGIRSWREIGR